MIPSDIATLIHYYICPDDHPGIATDQVQHSIKQLIADGLLEEKSESFVTTEKGKVMIQILCNTPMPQQVWADDNGNIILP